MTSWSPLIRFSEILQDDSSFGRWGNLGKYFSWRRRNCGFFHVFAGRGEFLFSYGPTSDGGTLDLRTCIQMLRDGSDSTSFLDFYDKLYLAKINPSAGLGTPRPEILDACRDYIRSKCSFRFFDIGRRVPNLWDHCEPSDDENKRFVPDSFFTFGSPRQRRAEILEIITQEYVYRDESGLTRV